MCSSINHCKKNTPSSKPSENFYLGRKLSKISFTWSITSFSHRPLNIQRQHSNCMLSRSRKSYSFQSIGYLKCCSYKRWVIILDYFWTFLDSNTLITNTHTHTHFMYILTFSHVLNTISYTLNLMCMFIISCTLLRIHKFSHSCTLTCTLVWTLVLFHSFAHSLSQTHYVTLPYNRALPHTHRHYLHLLYF